MFLTVRLFHLNDVPVRQCWASRSRKKLQHACRLSVDGSWMENRWEYKINKQTRTKEYYKCKMLKHPLPSWIFHKISTLAMTLSLFMLRNCFHFASITSSDSTVHFVVLIHSEVNSRQIYRVLWGYEMEMMMKLNNFSSFCSSLLSHRGERKLISPDSIVCVSHIPSYAITELGRRGCLSSHQGRKQNE